MKYFAFSLVFALIWASASTAAERRPEPVNLYNTGKEVKVFKIFETLQANYTILAHEDVFVASARFFKDADGDSYVCGSAKIPSTAAPVKFIWSYTNPLWKVTDDEWRSMSCDTLGGSLVEQTTKPGAHMSLLIGRPDPGPTPTSRAKIPAIPPDGPLPLGVRQMIAIEFQDTLSQILGGQVRLVSDRSYKEQDGTNTFCAAGMFGGKRFRLARAGGDKPIINPTEAQWAAAGCTRPGYQLIR